METYYRKASLLLALLMILMVGFSCSKKEPFKISEAEFRIDDGCPEQSDLHLTLEALTFGDGLRAEGVYKVGGKSVFSIDPKTGQMKSLNWCPGVEQTLIGNLDIVGYKFESDSSDPLVFKIIKGQGYVHIRGKGTIITPKGTMSKLESSKPMGEKIKSLGEKIKINLGQLTNNIKTVAPIKYFIVSRQLSAIKDEDSGVRISAIYKLGELNDNRAVEPLIAALRDRDSGVRMAAASVLGQLKDNRAVEPLINAIKDADSGVRKNAISSLGEFKDNRAIEPLMTAVKDEDSGVRQNAIAVLSELKEGLKK